MFSLRAIIGLSFLSLVSMATLVCGGYVHWEARAAQAQEAGGALTGIAGGMADKINADMRSRASQALLLTGFEALASPDGARRMVDRILVLDPTVAWVGVTNARGIVLAGSNGVLTGKDISARPVFQEGRKGLFLGDVHDAVVLAKLLPNPTGEPMKFVDVAAPILRPDGSLAGVLSIHYSWAWVRDLARSLMGQNSSRAGLEAIIVAREGTVLLGPAGMIGGKLPMSLPPDEAGWQEQDWPGGQRFLTGYSLGQPGSIMRDLGWTIIVRQPVDMAFATALHLRDRIIAGGLILAALLGAVGWMAAGIITSPLRAISRAVDKISGGDVSAAIPLVGGAQETRILSQALGDLIGNLTASNNALAASEVALAQMQDIAYQDKVTSLPNRHFFERYLDTALNRARNAQEQLILLYIDLDGFKPVNDRLGHDAGDEVLWQVGGQLSASLRQNDLIARIGGDEFAAILSCESGNGYEEGLAVARRFLAGVNRPISLGTGYPPVQVGCSIGIAVWPADGEERGTLVKHADEALYEAKRRGKNRATLYAELAPARQAC